MTGSFPAMNLSVLAAVETLGLKPVLVSSVGASNFGANDPYFSWLDMEAALVAAEIFHTRSVAASLGGGEDIGRGLAPVGRRLLREAVERNDVRLIQHDQVEESIAERLKIYREGCGEGEIAAYLNVGGGVASLGHSLNSELVPTGLTLRLPRRNFPARGVLIQLGLEGVPVIHLLNIERLRRRYGLTSAQGTLPAPGVGAVYGDTRYGLAETGVSALFLSVVLGWLYLADRKRTALGTLVVASETANDGGEQP